MASNLVEVARSFLGTDYAFGDRKVFLSALFGRVRDQDMSDIEGLRRAGLITCARADLVSAMDETLVDDSQWDLGGATMHFIVVEPC